MRGSRGALVVRAGSAAVFKYILFNGRQCLLAALALVGSSAFVRAEEAPPSAAEVSALRAQVEALSQRLAELEARLAATPTAAEAEGPSPSAPPDGEATAPPAAPEPAAGPAADGAVRAFAGPEGFGLATADGRFRLRVGGRVAFQTAWFDQDEALRRLVGTEYDGFGFAFARIRLQARLWERIAAQLEFDFAGEDGAGTPRFVDTFIEFQDIPYGGERGFDLRLGHFYEPFSLEELTSSSDLWFNARSLANVFSPKRNAGLRVSDAWLGEAGRERLSLAVGVFKETDDWPSANDSRFTRGYQVTSRVTGLPWYADEGRRLLHVGLAYSRRRPNDFRLGYAVRPESGLANYRYVDPDALPAGFRLRDARVRTVDLYGGEIAWLHDRLSLQAEWILAQVSTSRGGDLALHGHYAQAGVFLTPDHRGYEHADGTMGGVRPARPVRLRLAADEGPRGWGAWEVLGRWSAVDLNDGWLRGGEQSAATLGINWFLNANARINLNYTRTWVDHDLHTGAMDLLQAHFQVEF
jgi:phosphate-selective porin OprO/OprP